MFDKIKAIEMLDDAKDIVGDVDDMTDAKVSRIGSLMCDIDEAIAAIESLTVEED